MNSNLDTIDVGFVAEADTNVTIDATTDNDTGVTIDLSHADVTMLLITILVLL